MPITSSLALDKESNGKITKILKEPFSIDLPSNMKEVETKVEKGFHLHRFSTSNKNPSSKLIIKMMAVRPIPEETENYELWQTEALISQLTHLVKEYHLSMKNLRDSDKVLCMKGEKITLGNNTFLGLTVEFGSTEAQFLNTIKEGVLYIFTLVSINPDEKERKQNLQDLTNHMKTIQLLNISKQ